MREPLPTTNESLARAFARGEPVALDQPFGFACRGCGHQCCINTVVLVSPPEAAHILWHLDRHPDLASRIEMLWGTLQIGGSSGLPATFRRAERSGDTGTCASASLIGTPSRRIRLALTRA